MGGGQADTEVVCSVSISGQFAESNGIAKVTCPGLAEPQMLTGADLSGGTWSVSGDAMTLEVLAEEGGFVISDAWASAMVMEFEVGDGAELELNTSGDMDVYVDWGDGSELTHHTGTTVLLHTYSSVGTHDVRMTGTVPGFRKPDSTFLSSLRKVKSWGRLDGLTYMVSSFSGCTGLTEIASDTDGAFEKVTDFSSCFRSCSGLTSIPVGLFDNCLNVTNFSYCFGYCFSLTSIPEGLFDNSMKVTNFSDCFHYCSSLTSIPDSLFANCPNVTNFNFCFSSSSNLSGTTPKDSDGGELWERAGKAGYPSSVYGTDCFNRCTGLSNYAEIPNDWK